jgi:hypothetical protein
MGIAGGTLSIASRHAVSLFSPFLTSPFSPLTLGFGSAEQIAEIGLLVRRYVYEEDSRDC